MNHKALKRLCDKLDLVGLLVSEGLSVDQAVETLTRIDMELEREEAKGRVIVQKERGSYE